MNTIYSNALDHNYLLDPLNEYEHMHNVGDEYTNTQCGVNFSEITDQINYIDSEIKLNANDHDMYNLFMSDTFYNNVNKLAQMIKQINFNVFTCLSENGQVDVCKNINNIDKNIHLDKLEKMLIVINKYNSIMQDLAAFIYINIRNIYKYCGHDELKLKRINQIIARLSYTFTDQEELKKLLNNDISLNPPISTNYMPVSESESEFKSDLESEIVPMWYTPDIYNINNTNNTNNMVPIGWKYSTYILIIIIVLIIIYFMKK
jgi:hypothetical protein